MIVWIAVVVLLIGLLILPVGVDAAYDGAVFILKAKAGPVKIKLLPKKEKPPEPEKPKKEKKSKAAKAHEKPKRKLTLPDVLELARIALDALSRLRKSLSVDEFTLRVAAASEDPYDAVLLFGGLNAGLSALSPLFHRALKIRREEIRTCVDLERSDTYLEARIVATLQIWEISYVAISAAAAFLGWRGRKKRAERKAGKLEKKSNGKDR